MSRGEYFDYLTQLINAEPGRYDLMLGELFLLDFTWTEDVPLDFNRAEDGLILRSGYTDIGMSMESIDEELGDKPCSVLEVLIALSQKMDYTLYDDDKGDRSRIWFWEMISNLKLDDYTNARIENNWALLGHIDNIIIKWLNRDFGMNGWGSPFPLWYPRTDQRRLQLIDQMNEYCLEKYCEDDSIM